MRERYRKLRRGNILKEKGRKRASECESEVERKGPRDINAGRKIETEKLRVKEINRETNRERERKNEKN